MRLRPGSAQVALGKLATLLQILIVGGEDETPPHFALDDFCASTRCPGSEVGALVFYYRLAGDSRLSCLEQLCGCVKADSEVEMESWVDAVHLTCAASYARHLGRDGTAKLLRAEIHKLENSIDLVCLFVSSSVCLFAFLPLQTLFDCGIRILSA